MKSCPSQQQLERLLDEELSDAERAPLEEHVQACAACQKELDGLTNAVVLSAKAPSSGDDEVLSAGDEAFLQQLQQAPPPADQPLQPAAAELPAVPGYEVLEELGQGGMGVVYKARHLALNRLVALKIVAGPHSSRPEDLLRFRIEGELLARLDHPHIVQIFEVGTHAGRPFFALEFVSSGSLADQLDGSPQPPRQAAALVEILARAAHAAHLQGIVHRDLKPANILLAAKKESNGSSDRGRQKTAYGIPMIADFGLAKQLDRDVRLTQSGSVLGTPSYMAPEQCRGPSKEIGPATDVYALGTLLYELLTGRVPFQAEETMSLLRQVVEEEPPPPTRLRPGLPRDLESICLQCLEKEPRKRYASAEALADDLRRFLQDEPIRARPVSRLERLRKWARRRPAVAALTLAVLALVLLVTLAAPLVAFREARLRGDAEARATDARAAEARATQLANSEAKLRRDALYQAYRARMAAAGAALQNHDVADAARQLEAAPEDLRGWEWRHLHGRLDDSIAVIPTPASATLLSPGPQGLRLVILADQSLRVLDEQGRGKRKESFPHENGPIWVVAPTPEGLLVLDRVSRTSARLRDTTGTVQRNVPVPADSAIANVALSSNVKRLAIVWKTPTWFSAGVYDFSGKELYRLPDLHRAEVWSLVFSPDGTRLATASDDHTARLWDVATGQPICGPVRHPGETGLVSAAFRPDGARIVTASRDGTVCQWDARTGAAVEPPYERHAGAVWTAVYSPDGQWIASAGEDRTIQLWRATGRQAALILHGHRGRVTQLAFTEDGRRLGSVSDDGTARIWEADPEASLPALRGHSAGIYPVAYSPDGQWIASGSWDGTVRLWDALTGELGAILSHPNFVQALAFGPDGSWLVSAAHGDADLRIWDVATARLRRKSPAPGKEGKHLTVSPDGTRIAATDWDYMERPHRASVIDTATGQELFSGEGEALFAYSPDGQWLAGRAADGKTILLRNARTHALAASFPGHTGQIYWMAFSPDSRLLVSVGIDRVVRVWDVSKRECRAELHGHTDEVFAATFHPDGKRLATAGRDRAIWLWDLATGEEVARLAGHSDFVWSLAFSPGGRALVSGSGDHTVRLWDTEPLRVRHQARHALEALRPEAERLVDRLFREKHEASVVAQALKEDRGLSELLRRAAFHALLRRGQASSG